MSEPQLSVRSTKARDLAHALARRTGQPIGAVREPAAESRQGVVPGTMSALDDLYDENGSPA
jgi:hypothetical protein